MNKRIAWIDIAKGLLIVLVVLGHNDISDGWKNIINSFHMAAFFFLSGVTFGNGKDIREFLQKKIRGLLIPYLEFCAILLLFQFLKSVFIHTSIFDITSGLVSIILPVSGRTSTTVYGLWFLPCLFVTELVSFFLLRSKSKGIVLSAAIACAICFGGVWIYVRYGIASILSVLPISIFFFISGYYSKSILKGIEHRALSVFGFSLGCFIMSVLGNCMFSKELIDLSSMHLGGPLYMISGISGTVAVCSFAMLISECRVLQLIGRDSLYYYGFHYEVIGIVGKIISSGWIQTMISFIMLMPIVFLYKKLRVRRKVCKND